MNIVIKAERVKQIRESKNLSQAALAGASKLGKRQIQRIEQHQGELPVRENTLMKLARGLRVSTRVLTGEELLPESVPSAPLNLAAPDSLRKVKLSPHVQLQYDLIEEVYGGTFEDLVNLAPILFTQLAERSLAWRDKAFSEKMNRTVELMDLGRQFPRVGKLVGDTSQELEAYFSGEVASDEQESIQSRDVFGEQLLEDVEPGWDRPYVRFLKTELLEPAWKGKLDYVAMEGAPYGVSEYLDGYRVPYMKVCHNDLQQIAGYLPDAMFALERGLVRIADIPAELMGADKTRERSTWIAKHLESTAKEGV